MKIDKSKCIPFEVHLKQMPEKHQQVVARGAGIWLAKNRGKATKCLADSLEGKPCLKVTHAQP